MISLSDIPCVGTALNRISEAAVDAAYRGLRYMFCYKGLVNVLDSEIEKINIQEGRVLTKVVEENNNGKILEDHVTKWHKEVEGIKEDSNLFLERYKSRASWRCIKCVPNIPNPLSRFRIGREAVKKAKRLAELTETGKEMLDNEIAHLPPVDNLPKTDGVFQNFASRKDAYDKLWESLVSEGSPQIHGIYGMPGVGKTRIAEQIWEEAKEKGVFDKVTKAVVSGGKLDVIKLQQDIAGHLNCTFASQDNVDRKASQLKQSLMNGGKVLIILDDVWREIPLNVIGIPIGHDDTSSSKGSCKILLTSRERKVCLDNNCIDPVEITALTSAEAWDMFKDSVGGTHKIESESLAKQVCNKCGGLPLLILAVGNALRNMSGNVWKDALDQLEKYRIERIPGIDQGVYACLKMSFDNLVDDDAKACLLLCSLYPEDAYISIDMLVELATGSELLPGGRSRVLSMVDILKSSSLVIGYEYDKRFKLHDIIRDVTRSIAVRDPYAFLFAKCDSRLPSINYGSTKVLCLEVKESDDWLNQDIQMTENDIHTLWIESAASDPSHNIQVREVASMFVNLRCLILRKIEWEVPVEHYLGKLRTLVLDDCDIRKTDFNFISGKLETLCIWGCHLPEPLNIINLKHLRKLQLRGTIEDVVANTSMKSLEIRCDEVIQLNIPGTWDPRNLEELTLGNCWWHEKQIIPSFSRLRELRVIKSGQSTLFPVSVISSSLQQQLQVLEISDCALLEDIVTRGNAEASSMDKMIIEFIQLKRVVMKDLPKLRRFMSGADYECHMPALKEVEIGNCGFSTLFPFSVTSSDLQQLWKLKISNCGLLEGIVEEDVRRGNIEASSSRDKKKKKKIIKLFRLQYVTLKDLPNLRSFVYGEDYECHMPSLKYVTINNCGFSTLFACSTNLQQLFRLQVSNCKLLEYIVRDDDDDISKTDDKIITTLSHLCVIELENLSNLKSFSRASRYAFNMPKLDCFTLLQCPQLVENFSSLKTSTKRSIRVKSDWDKDGKEIPDLNDYIKQNRKQNKKKSDDSNLISDEGAAAGETVDSNFSRRD